MGNGLSRVVLINQDTFVLGVPTLLEKLEMPEKND